MKTLKTIFTLFALFACFCLSPVMSRDKSPLIRFGLIADIQYCNCETRGNRFYRNSLEKLESCIADLNREKVQFTINVGDLTDRDPNDLDVILKQLKRLDSKVYNTTGNHDYEGITNNEFLYNKLNMPDEYYSFSRSGWHFIVLNTNEVASYSNIKGTHKEAELSEMIEKIKTKEGKNAQEWNGGISLKQMKWLINKLESAQKKDEKVLVFSHHPLYAAEGLTALNDQEILDTLTAYPCVKGVISGHHHTGAYGEYKGLPCITTEGMIETEDTNAYGIVDIYADKLILNGKGRTRSYTIYFK